MRVISLMSTDGAELGAVAQTADRIKDGEAKDGSQTSEATAVGRAY
jgi:hypothetical protein